MARAIEDTANPRNFVLSTEAVDSYGTIIESSGWDLTRFNSNPIALYNHDHNNVVGRWANFKITAKRLVAEFVPVEWGTSAIGDTVRKLLDQKLLRAASVGFVPKDSKWDKTQKVLRFTKSELVEASIVSVPANPEALAIARKFGVSADELEKMLYTGVSADKMQINQNKLRLINLS